MLKLYVKLEEFFDSASEQFGERGIDVELEHSLAALAKWESFWERPFLGKEPFTDEQTTSYVKMMVLDGELSPEVFAKLFAQHGETINAYIQAKMTATTIREPAKKGGAQEIITAELIYHWMISMQIPMECQYWHLNRLLMLIRVISVKNSPKKKMTMKDRRLLNEQNRAKLGTRG